LGGDVFFFSFNRLSDKYLLEISREYPRSPKHAAIKTGHSKDFALFTESYHSFFEAIDVYLVDDGAER